MPTGLKRYYGAGHAHFITCGCYHRIPWLDTAARRDLFLSILEKVRQRCRFVVLGYVVMPDHFHLLINEPQVGDPSTVMQLVKQLYAQRLCPGRAGSRVTTKLRCQNPRRCTFGKRASTISTCGLITNGWRNYATCIAIR